MAISIVALRWDTNRTNRQIVIVCRVHYFDHPAAHCILESIGSVPRCIRCFTVATTTELIVGCTENRARLVPNLHTDTRDCEKKLCSVRLFQGGYFFIYKCNYFGINGLLPFIAFGRDEKNSWMAISRTTGVRDRRRDANRR